MKKAPETSLLQTFLFPVLVLIIASAAFFRPPSNASNLDIVPDSVEYTTGAWRLANGDGYHIEVNGKDYPPRYPPWFSAIALSPSFLLFGNEPGNALLSVFALSMIGILAAYKTGALIGGHTAGFMAAAMVAILPEYNAYSRQIMSDAPATALVLLLGFMFLLFYRTQNANTAKWLAAGVVAAIAASFRITMISLLVPFTLLAVKKQNSFKPRRALRLLALYAPLAALLLATAQYNNRVFDSPFRNGYNFWCPIPYDFFLLTWAASYLPQNIMVLFGSSAAFLIPSIAILWLLQKRKVRESDRSDTVPSTTYWLFLLTAGGLPAALHLFYFFSEVRFYLPLLAPLAVITGIYLAGIMETYVQDKLRIAAIMLLFVGLFTAFALRAHPEPHRKTAADCIRQYTPPDCMVIASIDPVYLEFMVCRDSTRKILPLSRNVEYASKVVSKTDISKHMPPPTSPSSHRNENLKAHGAEEVFERTAEDSMLDIKAQLQNGREVFLDATGTSIEDTDILLELREQFQLVPVEGNLYKLEINPEKIQL